MNTEIIVLPAMFATVAFIVYTITEVFRRRHQTKMVAEFHGKLLDRIGSAREFGEFFNSEAGRRFMESFSTTGSGGPHTRILRSLQTGLVLASLGIGFFLMITVRSFEIDTVDALTVVATAATAVGFGLIISTVLAYLLSKRMGIIGPQRPDQNLETSRAL